METKDIILELRKQSKLSQDELAEKVFVTRQAVSRWENGETVPNTETLKLLSKEFNVSINTLFGSSRKLICQCCGMPLEDELMSHNEDGTLNEEYCKWCYDKGNHTYHNMDDLLEACVQNMTSEQFSKEQARAYMQELLPTLNYWKKHMDLSNEFDNEKKEIIKEINALQIKGMPEVKSLISLAGKDVNLEYPLPSQKRVKFLDDEEMYLGNQFESKEDTKHYFGILANKEFIMISTFDKNRKNTELILYKKQ